MKKALAERALVFPGLLNLGEIIYITGRRLGGETAENTLKDILRLPIQLAEASMDRLQRRKGFKKEDQPQRAAKRKREVGKQKKPGKARLPYHLRE